MKGGKEHLVPLSVAALTILESLPQGEPDDFVFPGAKVGTALSNMTLAGQLKRMGENISDASIPSSLRQWAGSRNYPREICEETLSHAVGNAVERTSSAKPMLSSAGLFWTPGRCFSETRGTTERWSSCGGHSHAEAASAEFFRLLPEYERYSRLQVLCGKLGIGYSTGKGWKKVAPSFSTCPP